MPGFDAAWGLPSPHPAPLRPQGRRGNRHARLAMLMLPFVFPGYLFGSVPFGLLLTRLAGLGDIRAIGSHSIGATNVLRTGRKGLAALTLLLDFGKGAAAVLLARSLGPDMAIFAGFGVLLGHMFPVWLRFKGGKADAQAGGERIAA